MRLAAKIIVAVIANAIGLYAAGSLIKGFGLELTDLKNLLILAAALTALNFFLKPILKLILGPIIILTLGLGIIIVNALVLYILDILSPKLMIQGIPAFLYASLIIGMINFIFHLATKSK